MPLRRVLKPGLSFGRVSLTPSLSKNENSAATRPNVCLSNRLQDHFVIREKGPAAESTASCRDGFFSGRRGKGFVTSQDESYVKKRVTLAHSQRFNVFFGRHASCDELVRARARIETKERDVILPLAEWSGAPPVLLRSLHIADGNYRSLVLEN